MLKSKNVGGVEIFRPSENIENIIKSRIKKCLFSKYESKVYTKKNDIINIIKLIQNEYNNILNENLEKIKKTEFIPFLVIEYERYGKVADLEKENKLSNKDKEYWSHGPTYARRGIKYLLELLCVDINTQQTKDININIQYDAISKVFIAIEELTSMYMRSQDYSNLRDNVKLTLNENKFTYFEIEHEIGLTSEKNKYIPAFNKYVPQPMFLHNYEAHGEILNDCFKNELGLSYTEILETLGWLIDYYSERNNPEILGVFEWREMIEMLCNYRKIMPEQAELIINGFSLNPINLTDRKIYKPKQEYRAYMRAFFKHRIDGVIYVYFSRRMALECIGTLIHNIPFKKIPTEWKSPAIKSALDDLSLKSGKWFESVVADSLKKVGIIGSSSVKKLTTEKNKIIKIPNGVGEIDFLGFDVNQNILVVIEIKQVGFATEPRMHQDDLSKFISDKKSYSSKFIKKYQWVIDHIDIVEKHIEFTFNLSIEIKNIGYCMITLYPTFAAERISDFSCLSLAEFMSKYENANSWVFSSEPNRIR